MIIFESKSYKMNNALIERYHLYKILQSSSQLKMCGLLGGRCA